MPVGSFVTRDSVKLAKLAKKSTVQTLKGSKKRFHHVKKTIGSADYHSNLQNFLNILSLAQMEAHQDDTKVQSVGAYHETGRKFDKVYINFVSKTGKMDRSVRYFIRRDDGMIFGAKSPMAPNLKWYFGSIYECDLWDWKGHHGKPLDLKEQENGEQISEKTGVKLVGGYGDYDHFVQTKHHAKAS